MLHERSEVISLWQYESGTRSMLGLGSPLDVAQERAVWLMWATDLVNLHLLVLLLWLLIGAWCVAALPVPWRRRVIWPAYGAALLVALLLWLGGASSLLDLPHVWPVQSSFVIMAVLLALPLRPHWWAALRLRGWVLGLGLTLHALPLLWVVTDDMLLSGLREAETMLSRSLVYATLAVWLLGLYVALVLGLHQLVTARWVPQWIDHFCATGWYADRTIVRAASVELSQAHAPQEVAQRLLDVARRLDFKAAILFWRDGSALEPVWSFGLHDDLRQWRLPTTGVIAQYLAAVAVPQQRADLLHKTGRGGASLQPSEQQLIGTEQLQLWLPLVSHGVLRSVLVVGTERRSALLGEDDEAILLPLLSQAAAASENIALHETLKADQAEIERLRQDLVTAQQRLLQQSELDRLRLAQELHDGVLQQLIGIHYLVADTGQDKADAPASTRPVSSAAIVHELHNAVSQVRGLIRELRPAGLEEFGFVIALEGYVARLQRERGGQPPLITLALDPNSSALPRPVAQCLFRVAQEALRNSLKHAQASQITISLHLPGSDAVLTIHDDGRGFCVPSALGSLVQLDHFGLAGMAERVAAAGGSLAIHSAPEPGTTVTVTLPLSNLEHPYATIHSRLARGRPPVDPYRHAHDFEHDS